MSNKYNKTYSNTFKKRIAITAKALQEKGESFEWVAISADVPKSTIYGWIKNLDENKLNEVDDIKFADIPDKDGAKILSDIKSSISGINVRLEGVERRQKVIDENVKNILAILNDKAKISNIANLWDED